MPGMVVRACSASTAQTQVQAADAAPGALGALDGTIKGKDRRGVIKHWQPGNRVTLWRADGAIVPDTVRYCGLQHDPSREWPQLSPMCVRTEHSWAFTRDLEKGWTRAQSAARKSMTKAIEFDGPERKRR